MPLRVITFRVPDRLLEKLDKYAQKKGLERSVVIRQALTWYLLELGGDML